MTLAPPEASLGRTVPVARPRAWWTLGWPAVLALVALATIVMAVGIGPVAVQPTSVARVVAHHLLGWPVEQTWTATTDAIVWVTRAPRVMQGFLVGTTLAIAGAALQAMVRNVLADPYVLGISSGASTGAAAAILVFGGGPGVLALPVMAFGGALIAAVTVLAIATLGQRATPIGIIMAGTATGYALSAVTSLLIFASDSPEASRAVMFWLLGSLTQATWTTTLVAAAAAAASVIVLTLACGPLDALAAGDDTALTLGVDPRRARLALVVLVSLVVGAAVSIAGGIGFVGLVVPHVARVLVGASHRHLIPATALLGGTFLVWADVVARMAFSPQEMPIGVVTGLIGGPFLLVLLRRMQERHHR